MTNDNLFIHQFSALVSCFEQFCEGLSNKKCWEKLSSRKSPHGHYDMSPRNGIGTPTWGWTTHESFRWGTVHPRDFCGQTAPTFIRLKSPGLFHPPTRFVGSSPPSTERDPRKVSPVMPSCRDQQREWGSGWLFFFRFFFQCDILNWRNSKGKLFHLFSEPLQWFLIMDSTWKNWQYHG